MGGWDHRTDFGVGGGVVATDPVGNRIQGCVPVSEYDDVDRLTEYRYRRPDGTVLVQFIVSPRAPLVSLGWEVEQQLEREPEIIAERRQEGQKFWWPFWEIRNGPNGKEWREPSA